MAARAAGPDAIVRLLETLSLSDHMYQSWSGLHGLRQARGVEVLDLLVSPLAGWNDSKRGEMLAQMDVETLTVDSTHPPTGYRISFIQALPFDAPLLHADLFAESDVDIAPQMAQIGEKLAAVFDVQ